MRSGMAGLAAESERRAEGGRWPILGRWWPAWVAPRPRRYGVRAGAYLAGGRWNRAAQPVECRARGARLSHRPSADLLSPRSRGPAFRSTTDQRVLSPAFGQNKRSPRGIGGLRIDRHAARGYGVWHALSNCGERG